MSGFLLPTVRRSEPENPISSGKSFDLNALLSLDTIRTHTKTDDVPSVTDEQLVLYRKAAFEAAELYTGMLLSEQRQITEIAAKPRTGLRLRATTKHRTQYPIADGRVYLFGSRDQNDNRLLTVTPGTNIIHIPVVHEALDVGSCCRPCDAGATNYGLQLMYLAGFPNAGEIPAGILVGMLRWIAWSVQNPGDVLMSVRNSSSQSETTLQGTNNVGWASGAIEMWRQYRSDDI